MRPSLGGVDRSEVEADAATTGGTEGQVSLVSGFPPSSTLHFRRTTPISAGR